MRLKTREGNMLSSTCEMSSIPFQRFFNKSFSSKYSPNIWVGNIDSSFYLFQNPDGTVTLFLKTIKSSSFLSFFTIFTVIFFGFSFINSLPAYFIKSLTGFSGCILIINIHATSMFQRMYNFLLLAWLSLVQITLMSLSLVQVYLIFSNVALIPICAWLSRTSTFLFTYQ